MKIGELFMKIKDIFHELLYDKDRLTITFDISDRDQITSKLEALGSIDNNADYDFTIKRKTKKRSKRANDYMWELVDQISRVTREPREDVYREAIRRAGVFQDVAVKNTAVKRMVKDWEDRGIGYCTDKFDSKLEGCTRVRLYFGSSSYDSAEMARLIDDVIDEAKRQNIETLPPDQVKEMKELWRAEI